MSGKEDVKEQKKMTEEEKERQRRIDYEMNDLRKAYKERFI